MMGLDINNQGAGLNLNVNIGGGSGESTVRANVGGSQIEVNIPLLNQDTVSSGRNQPNAGQGHGNNPSLANTPTLPNPPAANTTTLNAQITNTIDHHQLPNGRDLADQVSDITRNQINNTIRNLEDDSALDHEMQNFFDFLSKLYPVSLSLLAALLGQDGKLSPDEIIKQALKELKELGKLLGAHIDSLNVPPEMKEQLKAIVAQLTNLNDLGNDPQHLKGEMDKLMKNLQNLLGKSSEQMKELAAALENLAKAAGGKGIPFDADPELFQKLNDLGLLSKSMQENKGLQGQEANQMLSQMQKSGMTGDMAKMFQSLSTTLGMLGTMRGLPQQDQNLAFSSLLSMQHIDSKTNPSGLLGPNVGQFSNNLAKFILGIQEKSGIFQENVPRGNEGQRLYTSAFNQMILSAAVLGRMLAASRAAGDVTDDAIKVAVLKLNSAKDLGIVDQIPFSFMAFFADLRSDDDDLSDAVKTAKEALLQLIRILLKLVFILVAIASAGNKLGEKGMNAMLEENSRFIIGILDALIFALKKVDENYVVNVNVHVALAQQGKDALALKNYSQFWVSMIHMFAEKTELVSFLKDMEDAKPLFSTIEAMLTENQESLPITIPLVS